MPGAPGSSEGAGPGLVPDATAGDTAMELQPPADSVNDYGPAARDSPAVPHPDETEFKTIENPWETNILWGLESLCAIGTDELDIILYSHYMN